MYLAALAKDYGVGLNGTSAFCGTHVTSPTNISLNNFQIVAIGKTVHPAERKPDVPDAFDVDGKERLYRYRPQHGELDNSDG